MVAIELNTQFFIVMLIYNCKQVLPKLCEYINKTVSTNEVSNKSAGSVVTLLGKLLRASRDSALEGN